MKWFKRKKSKQFAEEQERRSNPRFSPQYPPSPYGTPPASDLIAKLPAPVLQRIFSFVCPHTQDETIRIDVVHYCELEDELAEKRKRRNRLNRNAEPEDTAQARLRLLCRTLRDNSGTYGLSVQFFKTPYMTRETSKADLARIVAVCPNLRYIDLPEGFYTDDPSCNTLKQEVQGRCPDIRKMTYIGGSERSLEFLASGTLWRKLEVLEFSRLNMDPKILRQALGSLPYLRALKVTDMKLFNDQLLEHNDYLPPFPPLDEMIFENVPNVTVEGLAAYLSRSDSQNTLTTLVLTATGVHPSTLQPILALAKRLTKLSIIESVTNSFPNGVQALNSNSLHTLHYEITSASSATTYTITPSYYAYLTSSLLSRGLPNLRELYVRDPDFPESLIGLAPPTAPFASDPDNFIPKPFANSMDSPNKRFSSNNPFAKIQGRPGLSQELEVYSKGLDEMEWNFSKVEPPRGHGRKGSASSPRPVSSYGLSESMGKTWGQGAGARRSVIVGNGFGGFIAVPSDDGKRPSSSAGEKGKQKRGSQYDMWR
ncbi:hypothetical protein G7Y89_g15589 [Cudoniella acicularis]|uniref:F-box domain-containing protein n=1 Tax=Cudoniella acicularis TaxID=354080 RepID=A0A8H4QKG4_9HELO|nr:hypothetical protein G7Y89_g15589 [Cudoniella acicularis]